MRFLIPILILTCASSFAEKFDEAFVKDFRKIVEQRGNKSSAVLGDELKALVLGSPKHKDFIRTNAKKETSFKSHELLFFLRVEDVVKIIEKGQVLVGMHPCRAALDLSPLLFLDVVELDGSPSRNSISPALNMTYNLDALPPANSYDPFDTHSWYQGRANAAIRSMFPNDCASKLDSDKN